MMLTTDAKHPGLNKPKENGQNEAYLVLSEAERAKGFIRPVRHSYLHKGERPKYPVRDLTPEEIERYKDFGYVWLEKYPESESPKTGRFWKSSELENGCGGETIISSKIAETYARDPKFYGSTYCSHCRKHFPVAAFEWEDGSLVGS